MIKFLFFDYREIENISGFARQLERPVKHPSNPLFVADQPWENGNMQFYGSVVKAEGRPFQMWYSVIHKPWRMYMAYAESEDGFEWRRPLLDIYTFNGERTNIVFTKAPHGPAVIYDPADPREDWRYKMVAGAEPSHAICAFRSADGIRWTPVRNFPVIGTNPDCPMGLLRTPNGRYAAYHRLHGLGRRVCRSESYDFLYWTSEPRMVMEPDAGDPTQIQFYGMGAAAYGSYEIGTLWIFHTDPDEYIDWKPGGYQEAELTYARSGYAWHRAAQGTPFIPHGGPGDWDCGNLQCASQPVFLDDEIRYYFVGTNMRHCPHWELEPQRAGVGVATLKPDRFVALVAGAEPAELRTCAFTLASADLFVNASTGPGGWVRLGIEDETAKTIEGLAPSDAIPLAGDSTAHRVRWRTNSSLPVGKPVRFHLSAREARIYSIYVVAPGEKPAYYRFTAPKP